MTRKWKRKRKQWPSSFESPTSWDDFEDADARCKSEKAHDGCSFAQTELEDGKQARGKGENSHRNFGSWKRKSASFSLPNIRNASFMIQLLCFFDGECGRCHSIALAISLHLTVNFRCCWRCTFRAFPVPNSLDNREISKIKHYCRELASSCRKFKVSPYVNWPRHNKIDYDVDPRPFRFNSPRSSVVMYMGTVTRGIDRASGCFCMSLDGLTKPNQTNRNNNFHQSLSFSNQSRHQHYNNVHCRPSAPQPCSLQ